MEILAKEKIKKRRYGEYSLTIPKYFLERMNKLDCSYVAMEVIDKRHILIEVLSGDEKPSDSDSDIIKLAEIRKIMCKVNGTNIIAFPPYFIRSMKEETCEDVILTIPDEKHIMVEFLN